MNLIIVLLGLSLFFGEDDGGETVGISDNPFPGLVWRSVGPVNMGGRVTDIAVNPKKPSTFYAATASGGVFRTRNNGATFEPLFQHERVCSIGDLAVDPSNPNIVWAGTGEANSRNSVSWGGGVYRSEDGGDTWIYKGLEETRHIGRIEVDPTDSNIVFVAALGRTWGPNPERGLFRTRDGGESWERVLFLDDDTGCIDVAMNPEDPRIIFAASYTRRRDPFDGGDPATMTGALAGIWRSIDGGDSWARLHKGLPTRPMGRIGLSIHQSDPNIVFAIVSTDKTGSSVEDMGSEVRRSEDTPFLGVKSVQAEEGLQLTEISSGEAAEDAGMQADDILLQIDDVAITSLLDLRASIKNAKPGDEMIFTILRGSEEQTLPVTLKGRRLRAGRNATDFGQGMQGGQIANAHEEQGEEGIETGGIFRSSDGGETWERVNSLNPRPFYYSQIRVDPSHPDYVYSLGISIHNSDNGGKSFGEGLGGGTHPDHHALWIDPDDSEHLILGNDGGVYMTYDRGNTWSHLAVMPISQFYNIAYDMQTPYWVYGGLQDNGSWGGPSASRDRQGVAAHEWIKVGEGDGFHCAIDPDNPSLVYSESQNGNITQLNIQTGQRQRVARPTRDSRFNWNTPFFISSHNPDTLFYAGQRVYVSIDQGTKYRTISDDISKTDKGSATALTQSPMDSEILYVGADDGGLFGTRNGGSSWEDLSVDLPEFIQDLYISDLEASHHEESVVYLTVDGHRSNDEAPYAFISRDYGKSWKSISDALPPSGSIRTLVEDPDNEQVLFVGTEFGCFVSTDQGSHWARFDSGLPTVPIFDLAIHPRDRDLIAGTHGRGIWIADIFPLQEWDNVLTQSDEPHVFETEAAIMWDTPPSGISFGSLSYFGENPSRGANIYYYIPEDLETAPQIEVSNALGEIVATLEGKKTAGFHRESWNLRPSRGRGGRGGGFGGGGRGTGVRTAKAGDYAVRLTLGELVIVEALKVQSDPRGRESSIITNSN